MNENLLKVILKELNLELGEEFKLKGSDIFYFKFTNSGIMFKDTFSMDDWKTSNLTINDLLKYKIIKKPYKDRIKKGEPYWVLDERNYCGYNSYEYENEKWHNMMLSRVEIFESEDEVKEKIKELGWDTSH